MNANEKSALLDLCDRESLILLRKIQDEVLRAVVEISSVDKKMRKCIEKGDMKGAKTHCTRILDLSYNMLGECTHETIAEQIGAE